MSHPIPSLWALQSPKAGTGPLLQPCCGQGGKTEPSWEPNCRQGHQGLGRILDRNVWSCSNTRKREKRAQGKRKMQISQCFQYFTPLFWETIPAVIYFWPLMLFSWIQSYEDKFFLCCHKPNNPNLLRDPAVSALHWPVLTLVQ